MKPSFKYLFVSAIALMAAVSCVKEAQVDQVKPDAENVAIQFVADSQLVGDETKTHLAGDAENTVLWDVTGETFRVFENSGDIKNVSTASAKDVVVENGKVTFAANFSSSDAAESFQYSAIYPESAYITSSNKDLETLKFSTAAVQTPSLTSYDPKADRLVSKQTVPAADQEAAGTLELQFKRLVALGKMTVKGLVSEDPVTSITLTAAGKTLAGSCRVNVGTGVVYEYGYDNASESIELQYDRALNFTNNSTAIFTCLPVTVATGETLTVTVVTESESVRTTFTKTFELTKDLNFVEGKSVSFNANFAGVAGTSVAIVDYSGTYAIVAKLSGGTYWAMANTNDNSSSRMDAVSIESLSSVEYTENSSLIWNVEKQDDGNYAIKNGENYLAWKSSLSNGASLYASGDLAEGTYYKFAIAKGDDTYQVSFVGDKERFLSKNNAATSKYFAFYGTGQVKDLYFVPAGADTRTVLATPANLTATLGDVNSKVVLDWDDVENANQYVITYGSETVTVGESSATITGLDFDEEYTFSVVAKNTNEKLYKASEAATKSITTGSAPSLVWSDGATFTAAVNDATKPKEVTLTWTDVENAESYKISWGSESTTVEAPATTTTVTCAAYETDYTFSIVAQNSAYKPSDAKTATATTGAIYAIEKTVAEVLAAEVSTDVWYQVTGIVSNITNDYTGTLDLIDETGTIYVYKIKDFNTLGVQAGDEITIKGNRGVYNNKAQMTNSVLVNHNPLPRAEFTEGSASFDAASPVAKDLAITYSSSVVVSNVSFEFVGTNADKFSATKTETGVSVVPVGDNATDAEYTATLNVMYDSAILCSIGVSQVAAGSVVKEEVILYQTGFESSESFKAGTNYQGTVTSGASDKQWLTYYGTPSTSSAISSQSMAIRYYASAVSNKGYTLTQFDLQNVTRVTYEAKAATGNGGKILLDTSYSTDSGKTWIKVDSAKSLTTSAVEYEMIISETGEYANVRIKFAVSESSSAPTKSNIQLTIDNVTVYGYN